MWSIYSRDIWFGCEFSDLRMGFMWDLYTGCLCGLYIVIWCYLIVKYRYRDYNPHKFRIWGPYGEIYPRTVHWNCTSTVAEITWKMCMACIYSIICMYVPRGYMMLWALCPWLSSESECTSVCACNASANGMCIYIYIYVCVLCVCMYIYVYIYILYCIRTTNGFATRFHWTVCKIAWSRATRKYIPHGCGQVHWFTNLTIGFVVIDP